jgi:PAS domain S-box-containing protein
VNQNELILKNPIADLIEKSKSIIMQDWIANVRAEVSASKNKNDLEVINHVGVFFDSLVNALRTPNWIEVVGQNKDAPKDHGYQRFQLPDYTLDQIIHEYHLFRKVVFDYLSNKKTSNSTTSDFNLINHFIDNGIEEAVLEFVRLGVESSELSAKQNSLLETASDYIWLVDHEHRFTYINQSLCDFWFIKRNEALGSTITERFNDKKYAEKINLEVKECFLGKRVTGEGFYQSPETQSFFYQYILSPVLAHDGSIKAVACVTRDFTKQKLIEVQLVEEQRKLSESAHHLEIALKERDAFLSIASHELKTPLTTLTLQAQVRRRQLSKGDNEAFTLEKLKDLFESDVKQLAKLNRLIDDMLDISRIRMGQLSLKKERIDLSVLSLEIVEKFRQQLKEISEVITFESTGAVCIDADPSRLEQVISNLVTNAMKYGQGKPLKIKVMSDEKNKKAYFSISDSGIGINIEDQKRIFSRFERAISPDEVSGLGLGLAIAKDIVVAHGGEIHLESELGIGSIFTVELPLYDSNI